MVFSSLSDKKFTVYKKPNAKFSFCIINIKKTNLPFDSATTIPGGPKI